MDKIGLFADFCDNNGIFHTREALLSELCTFRIGGPADLLLEPGGEAQLTAALEFAHHNEIRFAVLGRGSNILFSDDGFRGAVIRLGGRFSRVERAGDILVCQSGARLGTLCDEAARHGLAGLEFACGIPGTLGGAVYMNAGAYGGELRDVLEYARHIAPDGSAGILAGQELGLSYRHSAYTGSDMVITCAAVRLKPGDKAEIRAKMDDILSRRREKQPLEYPSAGSVFKRPQGAFAAELIDRCGLKGLTVGGAQVSEKHAGFIVNLGGATCSDVLALIERVRERVLAQTGFELECEIKYFEEI